AVDPGGRHALDAPALAETLRVEESFLGAAVRDTPAPPAAAILAVLAAVAAAWGWRRRAR
ncbi:MAG TPA: hypothetical protein VHH36_08020, partial [Candidatus Thermoplasmatota archaeon]|nr:hypothetical protein [Candidatus Thermoplasmatota archaeon]